MLQGVNNITKSWVGRVVVAILFGFLIVSFAIWGIGDIFRGGVRTQVATVGGADIPAEAFRNAYQAEYQNLIRRSRQSITPAQARAFGLETRVLGRLVSESAIDGRARELGLSVSDELVRDTVRAEPAFRGPNGAFDLTRFNELLRQNGMSEPQYVREQRAVVARQQLSEAVTGALPVPLALREAVHRYSAERRSAEYVKLGPAVLGEPATPTDAQIQAFYDERKASYRSPEYRTFNMMALDPATLAKPAAVSGDDARRAYESGKDTRFGQAERRTVQQLVFGTKEEAEAAAKRIAEGVPFETIATERGIDGATLNLGVFTKAEMFDPAAADAAFGLTAGATSSPFDGRFGPALVRVPAIEPGRMKPFEEVADEVRRDLALERARGEIEAVHDAIEDQRAGAKALPDIARERELTLIPVGGVDRTGKPKDGGPAATLPEREALLAAVFRSDVGADNEAVRLPGGGYVWFEVTSVEGARDTALADVRARVIEDWRRNDIARGLAEKGRDLAERIDKGETVAAIAAGLSLPVETATDLGRSGAAGGLPAAVVTRIFATPVGRASSAAGADDTRFVFKVTAATMPPFVTTTEQAAGLEGQLRTVLTEDLLAEYVADLEKKAGVKTYPENIRRAIGGET